MRISLVSQHLPDPEGRAPDRALWALGTGLVGAGHELRAWSWRPEPPDGDVPPWCCWRPLPAESRVRTRARAVVRPRSDIVAARWRPETEPDVAVADGPQSFPAVRGQPRTAVILHYRVALDVGATRRWSPKDVQDLRAERRCLGAAGQAVAYSARVAERTPAVAVPIGLAMPAEPLPPVDDPVAACLADWRWPPNGWALRLLLDAWPSVRDRVPGAELRLAGRGLEGVGARPGVAVLGPVTRSADVLAEAAVVAFPCPSSSGPKVKTLEALAHGRPVVTTSWGTEGLAVPPGIGTFVARPEPASFADTLAAALLDPGRARQVGIEGRQAVVDAHRPAAAAQAQVAVFLSRWPELASSG